MSGQRTIEVFADWAGLGGPVLMGLLMATPTRGKEVISFEYDSAWLSSSRHVALDPSLQLFPGPQFPSAKQANFRVFLDSCPDRWGRVLMQRREAYLARVEGRAERKLMESDYLLGVHDETRMGGLRFREGGAFLDDQEALAAPPWTSLRELEHACTEFEREGAESRADYGQWLRLLIAPGSSLGGARPKAGVVDQGGRLWIAKFPSLRDGDDVGAWEGVVHELAGRAGVCVPLAHVERFASSQHTFLSQRFDRTRSGARLHFASAMTLLERSDGDDAALGASYLELAEVLTTSGAQTSADLEELFRRIAFSVCVSNTDDHLRNHGFLLDGDGWRLAPAYDMNPDPHGEGLKLNISDTDNAQDLELVADVAPFFRVADPRRVIEEVRGAVRTWGEVATARGLGEAAQRRMRRAFRVADR